MQHLHGVQRALRGEGHRVRTSIALFFACLVVYHANFRPLSQVDTVAAPYAAWSLVERGTLELQYYEALDKFVPGAIREDDRGRRISIYPPGSALAAVPIVLPFTLVRDEPPGSGAMRRIGKLAGASASALAVVFFWLTCLRLLPKEAPAATILFAFGTGLWAVASQSLWQHGPATLWLTVALYARVAVEANAPGVQQSVRKSAACELLAGLALGLAVVTRPTTALFGAAALFAAALRGRWMACVRMSAGMAIPVGLLLIYNQALYGAALAGGYAGALAWQAPWVGVVGLLVAPSRGLFVYSPAMLFAVVGVLGLGRKRVVLPGAIRGELLAYAAAAGLTLLLYASSWQRWGGWCYGPRYLIESMPVLCLFVAIASRRIGRRSVRARAWLVRAIAVSVLIQFLGVFGDDRGAWHRRHQNEPDLGAFSLVDSQIGAHLRHLLGFPNTASIARGEADTDE